MKIQYLKTEDIKPYKKNAKKHDETQVNAVAKSIQEYGFQQPIVVDSKNVIVIGHCRFEAAKKLGLEEIPAVVKDDLTADEIKALRIVDNKTNESSWNTRALAEEVTGLPDVDFTDFGFGNFEIMTLKSFNEPEVEEIAPIATEAPERQTVADVEKRAQTQNYDASNDENEEIEINTKYDDEEDAEQSEQAQNTVETGRYIFIMHSDEEIEWLKAKLGITGDLQLSYRIQNLMEDSKNEGN